MREGLPSPSRGGDGIYFLSTGDGGPLPRGPLHIVQYGANDEILLILRHEKEVTDPGYVDFFSSPNNRPADGVHRLVLQVPARGINQVIFQCSFREEAIGGALTRRLEHFLATREYRSYTGYPQP